MQRLNDLPADWRGSAAQLADVLGCPRSTIYGHVRAGRLAPSLIRGLRRYFDLGDAKAFASWYVGEGREGRVGS